MARDRVKTAAVACHYGLGDIDIDVKTTEMLIENISVVIHMDSVILSLSCKNEGRGGCHFHFAPFGLAETFGIYLAVLRND